METKKNITYIRTETALLHAYFHLLAKKKPEKISVKDLYQSAGINSATFYRHYKNGMPAFVKSLHERLVSGFRDRLNIHVSKVSHDILKYPSLPDLGASFTLDINLLNFLKTDSARTFLDYEEQTLINHYRSKHPSISKSELGEKGARIRMLFAEIVHALYCLQEHTTLDAEEQEALRNSLRQCALEMLSLLFPEDINNR